MLAGLILRLCFDQVEPTNRRLIENFSLFCGFFFKPKPQNEIIILVLLSGVNSLCTSIKYFVGIFLQQQH